MKERHTGEVVINIPEDSLFITEAFGINDGFKRKLYDIDIPKFDNLVFITGESGSGKTHIMKQCFGEQTTTEFDKSTPIFKLVSDDEEEALRWLSFIGLGDALVFPLTYSQLSDSQQKRFEIIMAVLNNDLVIIDEFLSTLDRKTAKGVAYAFQKMIRKLGKKAVVVTAHDDLEDYLMPDVVIKGFSGFKNFVVECNSYADKMEDVDFWFGTKNDYKNSPLGDYHYRGKYTGGVKEYLFADVDGKTVGVLVSINQITNPEFRKISRLVVDPSYRGCGIGRRLTEAYLKHFPMTEVIAVMAKYNPVFEKAGMVRVDDSVIKPPTGIKRELKTQGFSFDKWHSKEYCEEWCTLEENRQSVSLFAKYANKIVQPGGKKLSVEEISTYIRKEPKTAARVLYQLRPKSYAKFKTKELLGI